MRKLTILFCYSLLTLTAFAQGKGDGLLSGNVLDENKKAIENASVTLVSFNDSLGGNTIRTDKNGAFTFTTIPFGYYRLRISFVGKQQLTLDSLHFRTERSDFNLNDIVLKVRNELLEEVIIYSEKPLIESKDGNITFNAGESALAAGSNASDLLNNVPLVAKGADGKITVRGKEPKILIDDKPVELNMQQLQDLLESMPGSSVEKIEVMTNPPPQYATEQGGVINIVTRKGRVGKSGRIAISTGTRGEANISGNYTYRKQGIAISVNGGIGYNRLNGNGYSIRNNIYTDSSNFFNTSNQFRNKSIRPNFRLNLDYDINKKNIINLVLNFNQYSFDNNSSTEYKNINRFGDTWRLSRRDIGSTGDNINPSINFTYTWKGKPGETLRLISGLNLSFNNSDRDYYQQFLNPDYTFNGTDSTQEQLNRTRINGHNFRLSYDKMLDNKKTFLSFAGTYNRSNNHVDVDASFKKKPEGTMAPLDLLSNDFWFHQTVSTLLGSVKQILAPNFSFTAGVSAERTDIFFELLKENRDAKNHYWTFLPFANVNRTWKDKLNITLSYRRSIRRPGIGELNPTIDFSDPYNVRFGNEKLVASTSHNFDLVLGRTRTKYYLNLGLGYNIVEDIFSQVRTLLAEGKTQVTWENISGRKEYEASTWSGLTFSKKFRLNTSASFIYNQYSNFDKTVRRFRDGGSFTSNMSFIYTPKDVWNLTGGFNFNRFANPQGFARWTTSMNLGLMKRFFNRKLTVTLNTIDPFVQQRNRSFTYGTNFNLESYSSTRTRNYRLSLAYNFSNAPKKKPPVKPAATKK